MGSLWTVTFGWPLANPLPSVNNLREHWAVKAKRVKAQRALTKTLLLSAAFTWLRHWRTMRANERLRVGVLLTRISPRQLDDDNLRGAFKAIRDEIAGQVGIDDRSSRYVWEYHQRKGPPGVEVTLQVLQPGGEP